MGERKFQRAKNYHQDRFKFIDKLSLTEMSKMADALRIVPTLFSFDCEYSFRSQKIEPKISWHFIKYCIRTY